jgi:hypothetical protein
MAVVGRDGRHSHDRQQWLGRAAGANIDMIVEIDRRLVSLHMNTRKMELSGVLEWEGRDGRHESKGIQCCWSSEK